MAFPKHYSLHSEDDSHFTIHDKRDGKTFKVAKKQIHPAHQIKIMKMQKMSEGGEAEDTGADGPEEGVFAQQEGSEVQPPQSLAANDVAQNMRTPQLDLSVPTSMSPEPTSQPQAQGEGEVPVQASVPSTNPSNLPTSQEEMGLAKQQVAAVQAEATATQKQQQAMAAQYQKNIEEEQKLMQTQQEKMAQYQTQYDNIAQEVASAKIDPNKFWHDKSTGEKISSAIGVILGGLGAGLTHGPNMALQKLNTSIERDIQAQRDNLGNKRSLLSDNLRAQGNLQSAMSATRLQMAAIAQGKLLKIAAETGNPIIAARAQQSAAQIMQGTIPLRTHLANNEIQMSIRSDVIRRLQSQGKPGAQPVDMQDLARAGFVDKGTAEKEGAAISKRQQAEAYAIDQFKKLDEEQRVWGSSGNGNTLPNIISPASFHKRDQFRAGIIQAIQSASPSKRLNPEMLALEVEPFLTKTFESDTSRKTALEGMLGLIRSHADPTPIASHYQIPGAIGGKNTVGKSYKLGPVK